MSLPPPSAERTRKHLRRVDLDGYKRVDGLWDIEARLTDRKDHDYPLASGVVARGEPVHDMLARVTIDREMTIVEAVVVLAAAPYNELCGEIAPDYGDRKSVV